MTEVILLLVRWVHSIAALTWIGGAIFYWLIMRPSLQSGLLPDRVLHFARQEFGQIVVLSMWALLITGSILFFERISLPSATTTYVAVLGLKVMLSAWMFFLTIGPRGRSVLAIARQGKWRGVVNALGHINMTIILGLAIFLLSDYLRLIIENHVE
tara:strand:+ start:1715 stop:2182 length:468 start_codon:yes stop_codon:yes gene_type:complete